MIAIAEDKRAAKPVPGLSFRAATAETIAFEPKKYDAFLGFNYLLLVGDPQIALRHIYRLLVPGGLFISKTPCLGDMNVFIRSILLPAMRTVGLAPYVSVLSAQDLTDLIRAVGFEIVATERHATKSRDARPFVVACKAQGTFCLVPLTSFAEPLSNPNGAAALKGAGRGGEPLREAVSANADALHRRWLLCWRPCGRTET